MVVLRGSTKNYLFAFLLLGAPPPDPHLVGLRPPGAARSPQPGPQGPKTSFGIMDLELFGPKMGFGEIEKQKGARMGPKWVHLG